MGEAEFKELMRARLAKMKELGLVDIDEETKKVVITGEYLVFGTAKAQDDSHKALALRISSNETPFSMFYLITDKEELRKLKAAIEVILTEDGGVETV